MEFKQQIVIIVGKEKRKSAKGNEYTAVSVSDGAYPLGMIVSNDVKYDDLKLFEPIEVDMSITLGKYPKAELLRVYPVK